MKPHIKLHEIDRDGRMIWSCKKQGTITWHSSQSPSEVYRAWDLCQKNGIQWKDFSNEHHSRNNQELE